VPVERVRGVARVRDRIGHAVRQPVRGDVVAVVTDGAELARRIAGRADELQPAGRVEAVAVDVDAHAGSGLLQRVLDLVVLEVPAALAG
jgi:hypothetical protein